MNIQGIIHQNQLWVQLKVSGYHNSKDIWFRIDTGFDGELSLPVNLAIPLGLALVGESSYNIAGGGVSSPFRFVASIQWGSKSKLASIDVDRGQTPLLGMNLLVDYLLLVDFKQKTLLIREPEEKKEETGKKEDIVKEG